jgi:hypothetical protein
MALIVIADDPYSLEQLKSPRMNVAVVRPLVKRLYELRDVSIGDFPFPSPRYNFRLDQGSIAIIMIFYDRHMNMLIPSRLPSI